MKKTDPEEKALLQSIEKGEWKSTGLKGAERARLKRAAAATLRKDRRVNLRISSRDLDAIKKRALLEGLPYQTLIASVIHRYAAGRLREADR
jgi:predicted DNA binding CopG/RHH family protein